MAQRAAHNPFSLSIWQNFDADILEPRFAGFVGERRMPLQRECTQRQPSVAGGQLVLSVSLRDGVLDDDPVVQFYRHCAVFVNDLLRVPRVVHDRRSIEDARGFLIVVGRRFRPP